MGWAADQLRAVGSGFRGCRLPQPVRQATMAMLTTKNLSVGWIIFILNLLPNGLAGFVQSSTPALEFEIRGNR
jgi:hypothetical protein